MSLKNKTNLLIADGGEREVIKLAQIFSIEQHLAGRGPVEGADDVEQGAFAGAGGADDGDGFAPRDIERGGAQHLELVGPGESVETFGDSFEFQ